MTPLLRRSAVRWLVSHPWQVGTTVLGVALAVAVVVGIDLANASAERAFRASVEDVAGRATHEIVGGPTGLDEAVYALLRTSDLDVARRSAPVLEGRGALSPASATEGPTAVGDPPRRRTVRLVGIDPFAESSVRTLDRVFRLVPDTGRTEPASTETGSTGGTEAVDGAFDRFRLEPGAVGLSADLATELGVGLESELRFEGPDGVHHLRVIALLRPEERLDRQSTADVVLADLSTAQEVLGRQGRLDRIDLVLDEELLEREARDGPSVDSATAGGRQALLALLPPGVELRGKQARVGTLDQMTRAFRLNLEALGLLALLVGMFLVYNTATFSVIQRRPLLGRLRAMGVTRSQIFQLVIWEALVLGAVGTLLGMLLGRLLAEGLVQLVAGTINDLYFALDVRSVTVSGRSLLQGLLLGLGGPVLAALVPAREAARATPRLVLQASGLEARTRRLLPRLALGGAVVIALAAVLLAVPSRSLLLAFAGLFLFVVGFACLVPAGVMVSSRLATPILARLFGAVGRLAARGVEGTLSRTGVAIAALVIAVATTLGVGVMVASFRATLVDWLDGTLQADIYLTAVVEDARGTSRPLDAAWIDAVRAIPGLEEVSTYRRVEVGSPLGATQLHALHLGPRAFRSFQLLAGDRDAVYDRWRAGEGVLISEPYAYRHGLAAGDAIEMRADDGPRRLEVLAVFYDYASDRGLVMMDRGLYDRLFDDPAIQSLGLFLESASASELERVLAELRRRLPTEGLSILPNRQLREASLEIFDRTFRITGVLRLLALAVAFLGILAALMALQLERARELGVLRANGLVPRQVWALVTAQTGLSGLLAGLFALPLGWILAALLIHVINKRSFGWTLVMETPPALLVQTVLLAVLAALLAGLYPAYRMAGSSPALALREE